MTRKNSAKDKSVTPETASRAQGPANNIAFIGKPVFAPGKRKILENPQPIERTSTINGRVHKLPPADFQIRRRLFYHEFANEIVAHFPHLYKLVKPKGN